jgi:hypothetical protein
MTQSKSPTSPETTPREPTGCLGTFVRLSWMVFGNGVLFVLALKIVRSGRFSRFDALYWAVAAGMIGLRYFDITRLGGLTVSCEPATPRDWRRYALSLVGVAAAAWVSAHTFLTSLMR